MKLPENGSLLRVFVGENDNCGGKALYEAIVIKARELNLAGATVLRGIMGFGAGSQVHTAKILMLSEDLPIVVEIVDTRENLEKLIPFLNENVEEGVVTIENVEMIKYRHKES